MLGGGKFQSPNVGMNTSSKETRNFFNIFGGGGQMKISEN